jgi:hypothetical protein
LAFIILAEGVVLVEAELGQKKPTNKLAIEVVVEIATTCLDLVSDGFDQTLET